MDVVQCDSCKMESESNNEFCGTLPISIHIDEPEKIQKLRVDYARKILTGSLGDIPDIRTKRFDFCDVRCLMNFDLRKLETAFDDWKSVIDDYKTKD